MVPGPQRGAALRHARGRAPSPPERPHSRLGRILLRPDRRRGVVHSRCRRLVEKKKNSQSHTLGKEKPVPAPPQG